jgi:exodeoxyribonuclease V gamma subunit
MQPGLVILHANQLETLAELAIQHCHDEPLAPLEEEIFLVQSNGMADWLKLKQAEATGISASMRFPMPASFLWEMYQRVLSPSLLNTPSPFAKGSLQWRILRLLPALLEQPEFGRPRLFLADDKGLTKRFQLSRKLADLLDQYQLYRADWLTDWEAGRLRKLGQDEAWQASLWRALIADLPEDESHRSRAHLHQSFLDQLQQADRPEGLPRRLFLFGINSLPAQLLGRCMLSRVTASYCCWC